MGSHVRYDDVFFNDTATTGIYTLSLHDALPIFFGERARTREGAMQVELAHLQYQRSRLVRSWTHLGRQRGGFGFLGGPGETQIEADRRLIGGRIGTPKRKLGGVGRTPGPHRAARERGGVGRANV